MATQTPNLGLTLPVGTENVSRQVINGNNTLIDTFAGGVNTAMDQMGSNLGILETGDTATHSIAKGEYVTWKGASYTADAAISIGETLAATGGSKNLTACDKGIANALNSKITDTVHHATYGDITFTKYSNGIVSVCFSWNITGGAITIIDVVPEAYRPKTVAAALAGIDYGGQFRSAFINPNSANLALMGSVNGGAAFNTTYCIF